MAAASPLARLLAALLAVAAAATAATALTDDVLALVVFKTGVADPMGRLAAWTEDDDRPCSWPGVGCDARAGRVTSLSLPGASLSGRLPRALLRLDALASLSLPRNNLSGPVLPGLLAALPRLRSLDLSSNRLAAPVPAELFAQCRSIRALSLARNELSGYIPPAVTSCASLVSLNLSSNRLAGPIPDGLWSLPSLRSLDLSGNELSGSVPGGFPGSSSLRAVDLSRNLLAGEIPADVGEAALLKSLDVGHNLFTGGLPESLRRLSALRFLGVGGNALAGEVPSWIGEMWALERLDLSGNRFSGAIPDAIAKCKKMVEADLSRNALAGELPWWVFGLPLQRVSVAGNKLYGWVKVPADAALALRALDLSSNGFSGGIPPQITAFAGLQYLNMSSNSFARQLPAGIGGMRLLEVLDVSANRLDGGVPPEIGGAVALRELRLGRNSFTGHIPSQIGNCSSLVALDLSHNNLTGSIPSTVGNLTSLEVVDLSKNKLNGTLPVELSNLPSLRIFDVSHNLLSGDLPNSRFFDNIPETFLSDNQGLCSSRKNNSCIAIMPKPIVLNPNSSTNPLSQATPTAPSSMHHKKIILSVSTLIAIAGGGTIIIGVIIISVLNRRARATTSRSAPATALSDDYLSQSPENDASSGKLVMFGKGSPEFSAGGHALLNKDCELGRGGFGAVYKTVLRDGQPVAIKKLTVSSLVKSKDDFERQVKLLSKVRHHNVVALRGFYWTSSLQLLIYDYLPGGNLHKHLHECTEDNSLSWMERFDIILGVARGLTHLHQRGIIHYNLKSSNVLLDSNGEPRVGDYGLAKLLPMLDRYVLSSKIQSALGYMAPEFACKTVKITEKCDVYGFGVLVLEVLTGRRPVEYLEDDVVVLCDLVRSALEEGRLEDCMDPRLCGEFPMEEALPIIKLGLVCTSRVPSNRPDMGEVVNILELVRSPQDSLEDELV
ncbi:putative receptor-like protein kinase [Oryza sativa Japonica Group]|uniref:Receptor-like protein kinase n=4 Tax=Oryza sativa subsp. japonica TaxID=39947 RepID=Q8RUT5_ORYSJ|nr:probable LRR receptor-like serine/threonine-protein kinase IRK [Oryza sativa Japonica Group]BAB85306.1 putative receptor-like protein kinase [Oryza sativa Japonica Group]BAB86487.1 putative receptor-like protein kinase [Oryza sativa Japonica Group]